MQTNDLTRDRLRELAALKPEHGRVLSVFLNLDPSEFATPQARSTQISSLIDEADRRTRDGDGLAHDEHAQLREDVARVREYLRGPGFSAEGAHGIAIFCSAAAGLFEAIKLPRPVDSAVVINDSPWIEPLAGLADGVRWCVLLVNRRAARLFAGNQDGLDEVAGFTDDTHGQHDQGGWSQPRYERSVEHDVQTHLKHSAEAVSRRYRQEGFDHLLIGAPVELRTAMEGHLHPEVRAKLLECIDADVENISADDLRTIAEPAMRAAAERREREMLDRLVEGVRAGGRGAAGLDETLGALTQRRVEILLLEEGFSAPGSTCPRCGFVGAEEGGVCPVDAGPLEPRDDVVENAIELALGQSAEVLVVRHHGELGPLGSIGAVLRF